MAEKRKQWMKTRYISILYIKHTTYDKLYVFL